MTPTNDERDAAIAKLAERPPTLTCLECKAFTVEPGYYGYYPGETTYMDIGCAKQVWRLDNEDTQETFERYMRTAVACDKFEPKPTDANCTDDNTGH